MKKKVKREEVMHKGRDLNKVTKLDMCEDKLQQKHSGNS
jgi:hypothetical protein